MNFFCATPICRSTPLGLNERTACTTREHHKGGLDRTGAEFHGRFSYTFCFALPMLRSDILHLRKRVTSVLRTLPSSESLAPECCKFLSRGIPSRSEILGSKTRATPISYRTRLEKKCSECLCFPRASRRTRAFTSARCSILRATLYSFFFQLCGLTSPWPSSMTNRRTPNPPSSSFIT